jgi:Fe-S-cluster containining protein
MSEVIWINPVVKGSCDPFGSCGTGCCKVKVYKPGNKEYDLRWCEYFDEPARKCKIYETRPNGCRTYPLVRNLQHNVWSFPGCGYYLEEQAE